MAQHLPFVKQNLLRHRLSLVAITAGLQKKDCTQWFDGLENGVLLALVSLSHDRHPAVLNSNKNPLVDLVKMG